MRTLLDVSAKAAPVDRARAKEHFHDGPNAFYGKVKGIKAQIQKGRYNRYALIEDGRMMVNYFVYWDYSKYRKRLEDDFEARRVPPFSPREMAEMTPVQVLHHFYGKAEGNDE